MMGSVLGRMPSGWISTTSTTKRCKALTILILWIGMTVASSLPAQSLNVPSITASDAIGVPLPTIQLPLRGVPTTRTGGITCRIRFGQESVVGYVAAEITVAKQGKFAADRDLVFRFRGVDQEVYPPRRNLVVDVPVMLQQGTASKTVTRYLPRWAVTRQMSIDVLEEGRPIPDLSAEIEMPQDVGANPRLRQGNKASLRYSAIALQSETRFDPLVVTGAEKPTKVESRISRSLLPDEYATGTLHPLSRMPTDWRAYQRFDAIVLSADLCEQLGRRPDTLDAVRYWLMMGGTIVVVGKGDPAGIMNRLGLSDASETSRKELEEQVASAADNLESSQPQRKRKLRSIQQAQARTSQQWNQRIWIRPVAAGQVIGLPISPGFHSIEKPDLYILDNLIGFFNSPMLRRGVDPMIGDSRFRNWLIPGVAQPPVYTFIGLLSVFVILVGPVAYRQTTRHHRSHLMFMIAPVLAIITTAMMFAYGIVSDGFGTMARIRQLTLVDGTSATGVERIRSTYFAGVRPADGLRFGGSDEVMAYPETQHIAWSDHLSQTPQAIGRVTIDEDEQHFDSSFLPSRSQTQFVVHRPVPNIGSLQLSIDPDGSVVLINDFDFPLRRIVVRQSKKNYLTVDSISPRSTSKVIDMDAKDVSKKLGSLYNDFRPILSTSTESRNYQNSGKTFDLLRELAQGVTPGNTTYDGVFELAYRHCLQTRLEIPVGYFVAISDISEDAVAVAGTEQVDCVRYIMGTFVEQESP